MSSKADDLADKRAAVLAIAPADRPSLTWHAADAFAPLDPIIRARWQQLRQNRDLLPFHSLCSLFHVEPSELIATRTRVRKRRRHRWTAECDALLATLSNHEVARRLQVTVMAVAWRRHALRKAKAIPRTPTPRKPYVGADGRTFEERWATVDWTRGNEEIAQRLGVTRARVRDVRAERRQAGLPAGPPVKPPGPRHYWTPAQDALFATMSYADVAAQLGIPLRTARSRRHRLNLASRQRNANAAPARAPGGG